MRASPDTPVRKTANWLVLVSPLVFAAAGTADEPPRRRYTDAERLALVRPKAVNADVEKLQAGRVRIPPLPGLHDYRCILHAHAEDSAHTGGTLPEVLADARKAGVHAVLLTDHFRPPRDFIDGRWRGLKGGVLFVPGAEANGFLLYPEKSILKRMSLKGKDFIDAVTAGDGMIFLSHIEERPDHPLDGLTGLEIYNRHYDAKRDKASAVALALKLTDPKGWPNSGRPCASTRTSCSPSSATTRRCTWTSGTRAPGAGVSRASPPTTATTTRCSS
jgi:hypothetical protein